MHVLRILLLAALVASAIAGKVTNKNRLFEIDYENDRFLKDGEPFRYVSGSLHYFRVPRFYWQDRLKKLRAAGLNVVSTYIEWSSHEQKKGEYDFSGDNDVEHFVRLAEQEGLLVILRPGPYICAERDLGGYPPWLLHENPNMVLRTNDSSHTKHVSTWLKVLLPKIYPLLYGNGGPVIMVQVENEYGSYFACDTNYTIWLRNVFRSYIGNKAVLFTTDGAGSSYLKCGPIPGVFITVDFGAGGNSTDNFKALRAIQPHGPLVNSEFYPGWLSHWSQPMARVLTQDLIPSIQELLAANVSLNFYVFFGGTNLAFKSGSNNPPFSPQLTSYDYDAPITEAGDLTEKYYAIKSVLSKFIPLPDIPVHNSTKASYGTITLDLKKSLFDSDVGIAYPSSEYPQIFEVLQQYSGFMLYETTLPRSAVGLLVANNAHDRTIVYVNKEPVGVLSRTKSTYSIIIDTKGSSKTLGLLVENQGHINYGGMLDLKGLTENVTLDGIILKNWKQTGYPLNNVDSIAALPTISSARMPAFYSKRFQLPVSMATPLDTFIDTTGWTKGVIYVNGLNLGRYWSTDGPQVSLYLPGPFLHTYPKDNTIILLELEAEKADRSISLVRTPVTK